MAVSIVFPFFSGSEPRVSLARQSDRGHRCLWRLRFSPDARSRRRRFLHSSSCMPDRCIRVVSCPAPASLDIIHAWYAVKHGSGRRGSRSSTRSPCGSGNRATAALDQVCELCPDRFDADHSSRKPQTALFASRAGAEQWLIYHRSLAMTRCVVDQYVHTCT